MFYNAARNRLKLLVWHHNGFILLYKRLERGRFPLRFSSGKQLIKIQQLQGLLLGLDWQQIMAGASLITDVIISKYEHHLPLYRQSHIYGGLGSVIPDNTLGHWVMQAGEGLTCLDNALQTAIIQAACKSMKRR